MLEVLNDSSSPITFYPNEITSQNLKVMFLSTFYILN